MDYEDVVFKCVRSGGYFCVWIIIVMSNVIKYNIEILYFLINGFKDLVVRIMNIMIILFLGLIEDKLMKIMWIYILFKILLVKKFWILNYFVFFIDDLKIFYKGILVKILILVDKVVFVIFILKYLI